MKQIKLPSKKTVLSLALFASLGFQPSHAFAADPAAKNVEVSDIAVPLSQKILVKELLANNPQIQYTKMQLGIADNRIAYEEGFYEAEAYATLRHDNQYVPNSATELLSRGGSVYDEQSSTLDMGVKTLLTTGAEVKLGYMMNKRASNIIDTQYHDGANENTGSLSLSLNQPLLKGLGNIAVENKIAQAGLEKEIAAAQFKQQLLKTVSEGLTGYWQLYRAQEALKIRQEALKNAQDTLQDVERLVNAGRSSTKDLMEAKSVVMTREADLEAVIQAEIESQTRLNTILNDSSHKHTGGYQLEDSPVLEAHSEPEDFKQYLNGILDNWPSYIIAQRRGEIEDLNIDVARDEQKPKFDLSLGYSTHSLTTNGDFVENSFQTEYPSWYVALNYAKPIQGNKRATAQEKIALDKRRQAQIDLQAVQTSLANDLYNKHIQTTRAFNELAKKQQNVELLQDLLKLETEHFKRGLSKLSDIYSREDKLNQAKQKVIDAIARYELAKISLKLAEGTLLEEFEVQY